MKESLSKDIIFDFFDGRTTAIQRKLVEDWLASAENEELYYQYLDEWESRHPQFEPQVDKALSDFLSLLKNEDKGKSIRFSREETSRPSTQRGLWLWAAAAACLTLFSLFVFRSQIRYKSLESASGQIQQYTLSDGTRIVLNANSVLRIPRFGFGKEMREVLLEGEAEFKVFHTADNSRFVVRMQNGMKIEVLGTEFIAFSRARGTKVFLTEGKVKLSLPKGKQLYMKPGNLFSTDAKGGFVLSSPAAAGQFTAWKKEMFYFDNTLLSEVVAQLNDRFKVDVRIPDPVLAAHRIGGIYKAHQAEDLLKILTELLQLEVVKHDDFIELRKSVNNLTHD